MKVYVSSQREQQMTQGQEFMENIEIAITFNESWSQSHYIHFQSYNRQSSAEMSNKD